MRIESGIVTFWKYWHRIMEVPGPSDALNEDATVAKDLEDLLQAISEMEWVEYEEYLQETDFDRILEDITTMFDIRKGEFMDSTRVFEGTKPTDLTQPLQTLLEYVEDNMTDMIRLIILEQ